MTRWIFLAAGFVFGLVALHGCKDQCHQVCPDDFTHLQESLGVPAKLPCEAPAIPDPGLVIKPTSVDQPDQPPRYLSLAEAIATALEHGRVGNPNLYNGLLSGNSLGANLSLVSFQGTSVGPSDSIRVLSVDPAIIGSNIEASLAKFDARFTSSLTWNTTDEPVATALQQFQTSGAQGLNSINTNDANFSAGLLKPLPTGGVAGVTFTTAYEFTNLPARVNPSYRPNLQFQFEQPLLQGFGVEINQLRATHPGSVLTPFNTGGRVEGILITRLRFDEQRAEFERQVANLLVNVETAYWSLYGAYWNLYANEQGMRFAYESWKITKAKFEAGHKDAPLANFAQARGQYELFRSQRLSALAQVLENEQLLRGLMGLPLNDGSRLIPVDSPTLAPYEPDWQASVQEAVTLRPELVLARQDVKFRQLDLINQKNLLLPDLRFTSTYTPNGIGSRLDGPEGAFASLAGNHFDDWSMGLRFDMPIGQRDSHSAVRAANLNLSRSFLLLQDTEKKAVEYLGLQYRHLHEYYSQIGIQRAQREAYGTQLRARFDEINAGRGTLDILLEAQRFWAQALASEYQNIVLYNNTLALYEFAKGTVLQHDNILISEGGYPCCAQQRAVEHERERSAALVARERANPISYTSFMGEGGACVPELPKDGSVPIPSLTEKAPKEIPDISKTLLPEQPATTKQTPATLPALPATTPTVPATTEKKPVSVKISEVPAPTLGQGTPEIQPPAATNTAKPSTAIQLPAVENKFQLGPN